MLINLTVFSQLKQKMADQHFERMEYSKCVEMYNELADKTMSGKANNIENIRKAAISNYKLFKMKKAIHYFSVLTKKEQIDEKDNEYYIQALRFIGKYDRAETVIKKAQKKFPKNSYFNQLKEDLNRFNSLFKDSANRKVSLTNISSKYGDFAPTYYQDGLVYATKSKNTQVLNGRYKWDDSFYISLMKSPFNVDSTIENGKLLRHEFLDRGHNGPVDFSKDEQKMVITKNELGKKKGKDVLRLSLYFSNKKEDGKWSDLTPFKYNDPKYNFGHGCFADKGKTLYFISDMPDGFGGPDIYRSKWENGEWSKPENLGERINTSMKEMFPFVSGDTLYFTSNGHFGLGGLDVFQVDLTNGGEPENLGYPINTSADDFSIISEKDGEHGFIASNRVSNGQKENIDQIYTFDREKVKHDLIVNVFEQYDSLEPVAHQPVTLTNVKTGKEEEYFTDDKGQLKLSLGPDETYIVSTQKETFNLLKKDTVSTVDLDKGEKVKADLILLPTKITIGLRVIAQDTKEPLEAATVSISNYLSDGDFDTSLVTNDQGLATVEVDRNQEFLAHGSKKGYIDDEKSFNTSNEDGRIIELELELPPITKGMTFKLDNIFYDFNRSSLRPKSMRTLDKLAQFLKNNNVKVELSAHTDTRGSDEYNQKLSQMRAQSCVNYLINKKKIDPNDIIAKGYGEEKPAKTEYNGKTVTLNDNFVYGFEDEKVQEKYHQLNRRTEATILEYDSSQ